MILYLTFNDQPSGVYWSQVTDVVGHLNTLGKEEVRLLALVSPRGFAASRRAVRRRLPTALVVPMVPRARNWRYNAHWLAIACRRSRPSGILARGVFATALALRMRDKGLVEHVGFDGRGAYAAEWEEYRLVEDEALIAQLAGLEEQAVHEADIRLAVSGALVAHWRERYGYDGDRHVVVPCTLGGEHQPPAGAGGDPRAGSGRGADDIVLAYAGSTAGWQSFALLEELLSPLMERDPRVHVLFLSRDDEHVRALRERWPGRVAQRWLPAGEVDAALRACDFGLLVREDTVTNRVASPTKFAEYLAAGLPVIISEGIGDFSALVEEEDLGLVYRTGQPLPPLHAPDPIDRERLKRFAARYFSKAAHNEAYRRLLTVLGA